MIFGDGYQYLNIVTYKQGAGRSGSLSEVTLPSTTTTVNNYYHIGTQPDGATNPLAVIDELHIHSDAEETLVDKSYDRGNAEYQLVDTIAFNEAGAQVQYADTSVTAGDSPIYKISSYNLLGESELQTLVQGLTVQQAVAPTNLAGSANTNAHIVLTWTPSTTADLGGGSYLGMEVERKQGLLGTWTQVATGADNGNSGTWTDSTVVTGQNYDFRVAFLNEAGIGNYSSEINVTAGTPPDPPVVTSVTIPDPNQQPHDHFIEWSAPSNMGTGSLTHYALYYNDGSGWQTASSNIGIPNPLEWTYSVPTPVSPNQLYEYKLTAVSSHGTSNDSNVLGATTPDVPDAPVAPTLQIVSPNTAPLTIDVTWVAPNDGGADIKGYQIDRWDVVNGWTTIVSNTGTTDVTYPDSTGISGNTEYKYKITAINVIGAGAPSPESLGITTPTVPDMPTVTLAINNPNPSPLTITATLVAPANDGGSAITGYNLYHSMDDITYTIVNTSGLITTATHDHTVSVAGVHYFRAEAVNLVGVSGLGNSSTITTPDVPGLVSNLVLTSDTNTEITASWGAPANDGGSAITTYTISTEYPVGSGNWNVEGTATAPTTTFQVTGLVPDAEYLIGVFASNNVGGGNQSTDTEWTRPNAPTNLQVQTISGDSLILGWDLAGQSTSTFRIQTDFSGSWVDVATDTYANLCIGTPSGLCEFTDVNLISGSNYNYRTFNTNNGGESDASNEADGWTLPNAPVITAVTYPATATTVSLSWTVPSGTITQYHIERESPIGGGFVPLATIAYGTNILDDINLALTTQYNYRIASENLGGIGLWSTEESITTLSAPSAPSAPTLTKGGSEATKFIDISWTAGASGGSPITNYYIERQVNGGGWVQTLPSGTGNAQTTAQDTGLAEGVLYEYRITSETIIGTSPIGASSGAQFVDGIVGNTVTSPGGNTVRVDPTFTTAAGSDESFATAVSLYVDTVNSAGHIETQNYTPMQMTASNQYSFNQLYAYPEVTVDVYSKIWVEQQNWTGSFLSPATSVTPLTPMGNNIFGNETRSHVDIAGDKTYLFSNFTISAQPAGYDMLLVYQNQDPTIPPTYHLYEDVEASIDDAVPVIADKDFYISLYLNPTEFDVEEDPTTGTVTITCDPNNTEHALNCIDGAVPKGVESNFVFKSSKDPDSQPQLGIEGMGELFGMPMVFIFIIGLAAVFTGRSAQMGSIFILVTIGIMAYLGYVSFDFEQGSDAITWTLMIFTAIIGILIGKRWS